MGKPVKIPQPHAVFTLGHSTLPWEEFIALLQIYGIEALADIRAIPRSRYNPQFNDAAMAAALPQAGIDYVPMKALGGRRRPRGDSPNKGWHNESFRGYADYMQSAEFTQALQPLLDLSRHKRTAIMCAEAVPWRCHRSLVSDALLARGIPVIDILSKEDQRPHKLTAFAQVDGTHITYPPEQAELL
jgi:uncharacterized protein (DUF488 family)